MKEVEFHGDSLDALRGFPTEAKKECGYQIDRVQHGHEPDNWKPLEIVGPGVKEIRVHEQSGHYRVIYVAKFEEAIHVLIAFHKTTRETPKTVIDLAKSRYKELVSARAKAKPTKR